MINKDDQDWLNLLAGKEVPGADPDTVAEANQLRAALLARSLGEEPGPQPSETEIDAFIGRARKEGLVAPEDPGKKNVYHVEGWGLQAGAPVRKQAYPFSMGSRRSWLSKGLPRVAFAASIILAVLLVPPWDDQSPDGAMPPDLVPKSYVISQRIEVTDPQQFVSELQASLSGTVASWQVSPAEDGLRIHASLSEDSKGALEEHDLSFPYEGILDLIVTKSDSSDIRSSENTQPSP